MKVFSRLRRHKAVRFATLAVKIAIALIVATAVATFTIDLGPSVRRLAERQGSDRLDRPIHIGRLSLRLLSGRVEGDRCLPGQPAPAAPAAG